MPLPFYRSETLKHGTVVTTRESAHDTVAALGNKAKIFFMDDNAGLMVRPYQSVLHRLDTMEMQLNSIFKHLRRIPSLNISQASFDYFLQKGHFKFNIDTIAADLEKSFHRMNVFQLNHERLMEDRNVLYEQYLFLKIINDKRPYTLPPDETNLRKDKLPNLSAPSSPIKPLNEEIAVTEEMSAMPHPAISVPFERMPSLSLINSSVMDAPLSTHLSVLAGSIASDAHSRFIRLALVLARRNVFISSEKLENKDCANVQSGDINLDKHVFFIYYHGSTDSFLHQSLIRLCEAFEARLFSIAVTVEGLEQRLQNVSTALIEKQQAIEAYQDFIKFEFEDLLSTTKHSPNCALEEWRLFILKEKAIHMTLNKFQASNATLRCNCWILEEEEHDIRKILSSSVQNAFLLVDEKNSRNIPPPSYFGSNPLIDPFQLLVNTYGMPRYKEINPGLFTIIPYPFLFGLMFGDLGHGLIVFIMGLFLLFQRENSLSPMLRDARNVRYMITLMGFFSMFAGLLYNEFFGLGLNFFQSRWIFNGTRSTPTPSGFPYPFGIDPAWRGAINELTYTNSFKMKFAIIVGFVQMFFGLCLRGLNAIYFRSKGDFLFTFLPQLIFFTGFVGYLVFLIVFKWITPVGDFAKPNLLNVFVGMFLFEPILPINQLFSFQAALQSSIVSILLFSIPVLLFIKPLHDILIMQRKGNPSVFVEQEESSKLVKNSKKPSQNEEDAKNFSSGEMHVISIPPSDSSLQRSESKLSIERHVTVTEIAGSFSSKSKAAATIIVGEEHSIGQTLTHQLIETTEFLLGTLSNTASYLRLWALSLAHAELSKILLEQIFFNFLFASDNPILLPIFLFVGTIVFVFATAAVILMLDFIEGALHALRLQWVEFQNKFYAGDGYAFVPLSFREVFLAASPSNEEGVKES
ncbi:putative vacuolar proton translocating ATPase subunit [Cardiosporidium cionae]|uniref:V-type proton ATPase subunit a n=1 Tax=Cardiosporidium cionae TaxID=476202 RepID=A0ABQ7J4Y1_9APIC|nr:putative vacuolar proton translocating ATPase subunit [Cardiosporidium cionae]|eukprot:KAF8819018.1 putative vacuolar proton translocating ATPase subunit [Cardiosporidium cionae]